MCNIVTFEMIESYKKQYNLTVKGFCELCRINTKTYYKIKRNEKIDFETAIRIARYIKVKIYII